jgi:hypothetical protein
MSASHSIDGLIKWAQREPWVNDFEATFEHQIGPACGRAGVAPSDLAEAIGGDWATSLWGWAFEDFVSSRRGERNVADEYLKRRGWKESVGVRAYISAMRNSTVSLYEVSDVVAGESFLARDLVRGGEPVRVFERSATKTLRLWDRIAARIVTVLGKTELTGALLPFPHALAEEALARIARVRKKARAEAETRVQSLGLDACASDLDEMTGVDDVLAGAPFMLSNLWLDDMLRRALAPSLPQIQNTDGEPLEFMTVHFPLTSEAKPSSIVAALDDLADLRKDDDNRWTWIRTKAQPRKPAKRKTPDASTASLTQEEGGLVLGHIEVMAKAVTLSVNSEARAERGRAMLEPALGRLVRPPVVERQTVEQLMASQRDRAVPRGGLSVSPDEERRIVHQTLTEHYQRTLDDQIPMLGGQSPRKAARTPKGRTKVVEWLKMLENFSTRLEPDDPMAGYDFAWLWQELGLGKDRR